METEIFYSELKKALPDLDIQRNHSLAKYTTVNIGGPADIFVHLKSTSDFLVTLDLAKKHQIPVTVIGNGSNILIADKGIRGLVIKNDSNEIELLDKNTIKASSGTQLSSLINYSLNHDLLGLQHFAYIPSTLGGAIAGNIHGVKDFFSQYVDSVQYFDTFIISATLKLAPGDGVTAKKEVLKIIQKKSLVQPMNSLGCVFKNPNKDSPAGMIIDQELNLKGQSYGDAQISLTHANFIINKGSATAKDYLHLINLIQTEMKNKKGFQFELEIKLLGEFE
jgi:UDP-N-acetylmuramate dehydrogenase